MRLFNVDAYPSPIPPGPKPPDRELCNICGIGGAWLYLDPDTGRGRDEFAPGVLLDLCVVISTESVSWEAFNAPDLLPKGARCGSACSCWPLLGPCPLDPVEDAIFALLFGPKVAMLDPGLTEVDESALLGGLEPCEVPDGVVARGGTEPARGLFLRWFSLSAAPIDSKRSSIMLTPFTRKGLPCSFSHAGMERSRSCSSYQRGTIN